LAALITKSTDALTEINALKTLQSARSSSITVELYEIIIGSEKTTVRQVIIGKE
jgi:hypothetical protein